jgi:hypothetical protein
MKKNLLTLTALLCCTIITTSAQEVAPDRNRTYNIVLNNVQYMHHNDKMSAGDAVGAVLTGVLTGQTSVEATKYEDDVKGAIIKGLSGAHRFHYNDGLIHVSDVVEEGNIAVNALITNINASSSSRTWKDKEDKVHVDTYYRGEVEAVLTLKDIKTGEVIANPTVKGLGSSTSMFSTSDQAVKHAIGMLSGSITRWLNNYKPITANFVEAGAAKKDKQKEVFINYGSREGAYKGMHMGIYHLYTIKGKPGKSMLGKLKIEEVAGEDLSRCKVTSGGKDVKEAIDDGQTLVVMSLD